MKGNRLLFWIVPLLAAFTSAAQPLDCRIFDREIHAAGITAEVSGNKRILWHRLAYADDLREPASKEDVEAAMASANSILQRISFGKVSLSWTITPRLQLPRTASFYSTNLLTLVADARACAALAGLNSSDFDRDLLAPPAIPSWMAGMAFIGGDWMYVSLAHGGLVVHELGHTFGLNHANAWEITRPDPFTKSTPPFPSNIFDLPGSYTFETNSFVGHSGIMFPGQSIEYGDPFDLMASSATNADLNVAFKTRLGWMPNDAVRRVSTSGVFRIYRQGNSVVSGRAYAIVVDKPVVGRHADRVPREYWIEPSPNGALLRWVDKFKMATLLLNTRPGRWAGFLDAELLIGRTFDDPGLGVSIKPIAAGADEGSAWVDVAVEFNAGFNAKNNPPILPEFPGADRIQGRVTDVAGNPVANCRVHNGKIFWKPNDTIDFASTETDANGNYTLWVDRHAGPFTVGASIYGHRLAPGFGDRTVTIPDSGVATDVNLTLESLPKIIITAPDQLIEGQGAAFTIARTGDPAQEMEVWWQTTGTATAFDYTGPYDGGRVIIPAGATSTAIPITAGILSAEDSGKTVTLHAVIPSTFARGDVTYFYPGWELRAAGAETKWFQTDPPYATFVDAAATIRLVDESDARGFRMEIVCDPRGNTTLRIYAAAARTVIIETSSDMVKWQPLTTKVVQIAPLTIALPQTQDGIQFYRARLVEP